MAKNETDLQVTLAWSDLTATYPELANVPVRVQNKSSNFVVVNFSPSDAAPGDDSGYRLMALEGKVGSAAHIWVKSLSGSATIGCGLEDVAGSAASAAATSTPLAGTATTTSGPGGTGITTAGPFTPQLARALWATLVGTGAIGSAQLLRSIDGGVTKTGLTAGGSPWAAWSFPTATSGAIVNEQVVMPSSALETYYLTITLTAGSVAYNLHN